MAVSFTTISTVERKLHAGLLRFCANEDLSQCALILGELKDLFTRHAHWQPFSKDDYDPQYRSVVDLAFRLYLEPYDAT